MIESYILLSLYTCFSCDVITFRHLPRPPFCLACQRLYTGHYTQRKTNLTQTSAKKMVISCWVNGCANRADGKDKKGFFSIPAIRENEGDFTKSLTEKRRRLWLANINRRDFPTKYSKICSDHFVSGELQI